MKGWRFIIAVVVLVGCSEGKTIQLEDEGRGLTEGIPTKKGMNQIFQQERQIGEKRRKIREYHEREGRKERIKPKRGKRSFHRKKSSHDEHTHTGFGHGHGFTKGETYRR